MYCDADIAVKTFHKLAYDIIAEVEGRRPLLAKHAADEKSFQNLIREILIELAEIDKRIEQMLRRWFTEFLLPAKSEWDFKTRHEYYSYVERYELRTLQGEKVRSFEELEIANWLCMNGITYEFEPVYVHISSDTGRKSYTPDFRLTACGVYIEHFGVRRKRDEDGNEFLTTAPYVDREKYLIEMEWKRNVHTTYGTTLVETFSYEKTEGRLLPALEEKIASYVDLNPIPLESILSQLSKLGEFDDFTKTLATFLRHFKGSDLTIEMCKSEAGLRVDRKRESAFLEIFERVYGEYQKRLGERIDFDDMISRATDYIKENRYRSSFRHLLVDEFQDISTARANLLIALKKQDPDARIFAVGDDWQSIYRFTGSNINLMQNFGALFGGILGEKTGIHRIAKLENTFRCVDRIANPARRFILKNPSQIEKNVIPAGTSSAPAISVLWSEKNCYGENLEQALIRISNQVEGESVTVLLIGRYNWLRPDDMEELNRRHTRLSIFFKSIHASKGLEADHVIILGAVSGRHGLPSEIVDDPLLDLALPQREPHEHAEERRVFYVALTRARESITIIVRSDRPSCFVKELLEEEKFSVSEYGLAQHRRYPCSKCGGQMILARKNRYVCEHWDNCDASLPLCSACGISMPLRIDSSLEVSQCECGAEFAACTECIDGWLVRRSGKYRPFLGCVNYPSCKGRKSM